MVACRPETSVSSPVPAPTGIGVMNGEPGSYPSPHWARAEAGASTPTPTGPALRKTSKDRIMTTRNMS